MADEEYSLADVDNAEVERYVDCPHCGRIYDPAKMCTHPERYFVVADIKVLRWQLTDDELKKWFPEVYRQRYGPGEIACPVKGCPDEIDGNNKRAMVMHARQKHRGWYEKHAKAISEAKSMEELKAGLLGL